MKGMSIDHIEHVLNTYEQINCQSVFISFWYLGTSAYVPRGLRPLPQRFEVPTPHSEIRVSQYQVPMILRVYNMHINEIEEGQPCNISGITCLSHRSG